MAKLLNTSNNRVLANQVEVAKDFFARAKGLLGRESLSPGSVLWIHRCNSIHTWFMKFHIDVVFVDKNLRVTGIRRNLAPWRLTAPAPRARSVFEFAGGHLQADDVAKGDTLRVDD